MSDSPPPLEGDDPLPTSLAGDVLLFLNLPDTLTVGYDTVSFTARKFCGLRDIPPGPHLFWISATDTTTVRSGFWLVSTPEPQVHILEWDPRNELLCDPSAASLSEATANLSSTLPSLTSYHDPVGTNASTTSQGLRDLRPGGIWESLTSCISSHLLQHITQRPSGPWPIHTTDRVQDAPILASEAALDAQIASATNRTISSPHQSQPDLIFTLSQSARTYSTATLGRDRTEQAVDATSHILAALASLPPPPNSQEKALVGEFQVAFLAAMHLGNEACAQQWWHTLLRVVLRAYALVTERPSLVAALLNCAAGQLEYDESRLEGTMVEFVADGGRAARLTMTLYRRRLDELLASLRTSDPLGVEPGVQTVGSALARLEDAMRKYGWDVSGDYLRSGHVVLEDGEAVEVEMEDFEAEDERGEFAAVVVELDDEGRDRDRVSWD